MQIIVTNQSPKNDKNVPSSLLDLFQKYISEKHKSEKHKKEFLPFTHQAKAFRQIDMQTEKFS